MKKRKFLKVSAVMATGLAFSPFYSCKPPEAKNSKGGTAKAQGGEFTLPDLPYAFDALAPIIDARTMEIHHGKHHAGYVAKLNAALKDTRFAGMDLLDILAEVGPGDTAVRNNGGGHFNHSLFWNIIQPSPAAAPQGDLTQAIDAAFGGWDAFKEQFAKAASTRFGSGWAWLSADDAGKLFISSTPNQDNPLMAQLVEQKGTPILGLDVWEHAYYLNYQNRRGDYIASFFDIINWEAVADNFTKAVG